MIWVAFIFSEWLRGLVVWLCCFRVYEKLFWIRRVVSVSVCFLGLVKSWWLWWWLCLWRCRSAAFSFVFDLSACLSCSGVMFFSIFGILGTCTLLGERWSGFGDW